MLALWVSISHGMPSLRDVKNYGRQLNLGDSKLLNIFNVKIKRFNVKSKQNFKRITADCARETDASTAHYRLLRPPYSCARHTDALIRVSFWKKIGRNCGYFCCKLPPIAPSGRRDTFSI